jgi:NitT/TauT family transport system substrate-binding protein
MNRRTMTATLALLAATGVRAGAQAVRTPMVGAPNTSVDQVIFYYAQQAGIFAKAGLDVTAAPAPSGSSSLLAVVGGAANVGFSNSFSLSIAHAKGIPVVMIAAGAVYDTNAPLAKVLVAPDSTIRTAKDLEGKTVAVAGLHDLLSLATTAWLAQGGADPARVRFIEMPAGSMLAALQAKRADAIALYQPFLFAAESTGLRALGKQYDAIAPEFAAGLWFASTAWANEHRDATLRFATALREASVYVNAHFDSLLAMAAGFTKIDIETLRKMPPPRFPPSLTAASIQPVIDTAAKYHELPAAFRAQDMIFAGLT